MTTILDFICPSSFFLFFIILTWFGVPEVIYICLDYTPYLHDVCYGTVLYRCNCFVARTSEQFLLPGKEFLLDVRL